MPTYESLESMPVWQKSMEWAERVFLITEALRRKEDYGLTSQTRRSALSVSGNIAEGFGRQHTKDKLNFYYVARGSLAETKSHLIYGFKVGYFRPSDVSELSALIQNVWEELNKLNDSFRHRVSFSLSNLNVILNLNLLHEAMRFIVDE